MFLWTPVIYLWCPKKWPIFCSLSHSQHPKEWKLDLLFQNNRIYCSKTIESARISQISRPPYHSLPSPPLFFKLGFTPSKTQQPLPGMELHEKEAQKDYSTQEICLERTYSWKMPVNSRLKATKIIGQRKAFYRQRIPGSSCARKETADIDILVTPRNGHRKNRQSIRITSRPPSRKRKWNQLSEFWKTSTKVIPIEKT